MKKAEIRKSGYQEGGNQNIRESGFKIKIQIRAYFEKTNPI
jgi:hypothetical protein